MPTTFYLLLHLFLLLLLHIVPTEYSFVTTCYRLLHTEYSLLTPYRLLIDDYFIPTPYSVPIPTSISILTSSKYSLGRLLFDYYFRHTTPCRLLYDYYSLPTTPYRRRARRAWQAPHARPPTPLALPRCTEMRPRGAAAPPAGPLVTTPVEPW